MKKAYIRKLINSIDFAMKDLQLNIDFQNLKLQTDIVQGEEKIIVVDWINTAKEVICDLDTIRQEYQKELDK